jgi:hypothetical protein
MGGMRNAYKIFKSENLHKSDHLGDIGIDRIIILCMYVCMCKGWAIKSGPCT